MADVEQKLPAAAPQAPAAAEKPLAQPQVRPAETAVASASVAEPAKAAPVSAAPVKVEVAQVEAGKSAPAKTETAKTETAKTETAKTETSKPAPASAGRGRPRKAAKAENAGKKRIVTNKVAPVKADKPARVRTTTSATRSAPAQSSAPQKETIKMATKSKTTDFTASFKDAGEKARAAFEKSQAAFGDAGEFAKGNLEAVVESSKILANGMKSMGETYVTEGRSAYETMTADLKALAGVKSPTEFFELQSKLLRKNFDAAVAKGSKQSEDMLKLANEAFQPLSTRLSLAMEKFKKAA